MRPSIGAKSELEGISQGRRKSRCPIALYTAASTSERIAFHTINRATGHRVHRQFVDEETGKPVEKEDQVKGYEAAKGEYVVLEPEEVAAAVPESDKTLSITAFIACGEIDDVYFDKPYYLAPSGQARRRSLRADPRRHAKEQGRRDRPGRPVPPRAHAYSSAPHGEGLIATTLNFDYEVRSAKEAFDDMPAMKIKGEMLELAEHIIKTKKGKFDASKFDDRYEAALADLVKAKLEGKTIEAPKRAERGEGRRSHGGAARERRHRPKESWRRRPAKSHERCLAPRKPRRRPRAPRRKAG